MRLFFRVCLLSALGALGPGVAGATDVHVSGKVVLGGGNVVISVNPSRGYGYGRHPGYRYGGYKHGRYTPRGENDRLYRSFRRSSNFGQVTRSIIDEGRADRDRPSTLPQVTGTGRAQSGQFRSGFAEGNSAGRTDYSAPLMHRKRSFGLRLR